MARKIVVILACAALLAPTLLLGGGKQEAAVEKKQVKIEWLQWFAGEIGREVFDELIAAFQKENPSIKVELTDVPFGKVREMILANHSVGKIADVLAINFPWVDEFVDIGILEPLDAYFQKPTNMVKIDDLVKAPLEKVAGKSYLAPLTSLPFVLFYNANLVQAAGISKIPETWTELREAARKITKPDTQTYGYAFAMATQAPTNSPIVDVYPLIYTNGGRTILNRKSNVNSPDVLETLQFIKDFHSDGSFSPGVFSKLSNSKIDEFVTGRIGFMVMASNHIATIRKANANIKFGIAPVPKNKKFAYRLLGWDVSIASKSGNKEEAWKFIDFLMRPDNNVKIAQKSAQLPGNLKADTSYLNADALLKISADIVKNHEAVEELMMTPKATPSWEIFTLEMQKMLRNEQSVKQTVENIDAGWTKLFAK
jgi:multiple sugar transport system substrate-binding protein